MNRPTPLNSRRTWRRVIADWLLATGASALDNLEDRMTSAETTYTDAWARFDEAQRAGFAELSSRIAELTTAAQSSGDDALLRAAARVDAARDSLAAGFAQFRSAPDTPPVVEEQLPPVINPETPPVEQVVPGAGEGLPVDPQAVLDDPAVATPNG